MPIHNDNWQSLDCASIERLDAMDSHKLVDLLWLGDDLAWRYVFEKAVVPMLKRRSLRLMVKDRHRSSLDICAEVFECLIFKRKLSLYSHRCPLVYWIRFWVKKIIISYCKKNDSPLSNDLNSTKEDVASESNFTSDSDFALKDTMHWCFNKLYGRNPKMAEVLYLRLIEGKTAREIQIQLKISSVNNVNKLYSRALALFREIYRESQIIVKK